MNQFEERVLRLRSSDSELHIMVEHADETTMVILRLLSMTTGRVMSFVIENDDEQVEALVEFLERAVDGKG